MDIRRLAFSIHPANSRKEILLMLSLTSFMDETGHADDPTLHFAGMAGFVAPVGVWEVFQERWIDLLEKAGLHEPFHMRDFAHSEGQFKAWKGDEERRRIFLRRLLEIVTETKADPVGAIVSINDFKTLTPSQQSSFGDDPYYIAFQKCVRGAASSAVFERHEEKVAMVFAFQSEFSGRAEKLWYAMKNSGLDLSPRMGSYASNTPSEICQLQAADLFAYELLKEFENRINRPQDRMRWGLRQIVRMEKVPLPRIILLDRKELLRTIREARFRDQTGTEELNNHDMLSAMQSMMKWLRDRGEVTPEDFLI
jgi:hypothetical protein